MMDAVEMMERVRAIVGPVDKSTKGQEGHVDVTGPFADALIDALNLLPSFTDQFRGKPVRVSRYGKLELWCSGWWTEGSGVRTIVDRAIAAQTARQLCAAKIA